MKTREGTDEPRPRAEAGGQSLAEEDNSPDMAVDAGELGTSDAALEPGGRLRRARNAHVERRAVRIERRDDRRDARVERRADRRASGRRGPVRTALTLAAVTGLVATVAIPAYAAWSPEEVTTTVQQLAENGAQSIVVASDVEGSTLVRDSYSATTPEEIAERKAEEERERQAEEAARQAAAARAQAAANSQYPGSQSQVAAAAPLVAPGSGSIRRPLPYFNNFGADYAGHKGVDYMVGRGTPVYSIADGVVVASSENGPGWGVYVKIAHNVNGQQFTSLYAHMAWGSRTVNVGDFVGAGQQIGQVSDTGRAYGTHLHLEVVQNGVYLNGEQFLVNNGA